jgi:hypothetical protein
MTGAARHDLGFAFDDAPCGRMTNEVMAPKAPSSKAKPRSFVIRTDTALERHANSICLLLNLHCGRQAAL